MMSSMKETIFPYCLQRQPDGSYVTLNRKYKPLGFLGDQWINYADFPVRFKFARLPPATIRALSWNGSEEPAAIFLYSDGCAPFRRSKADTVAYLERLEKLAGLNLSACP